MGAMKMITEARNSKPINILLVEDNPADVELTLLALKDGKISNLIHHVKDGEEAIEFIFKTGRYANLKNDFTLKLILLDFTMPDMDGLEVLCRIKRDENLRDIPVIMVTGNTDVKDLEAAFAAGASDYVTKPYKKVELVARVSSALRLKREIDQRKIYEKNLENKNKELEKALAEIKVLRGFIPICASCKKIRDDKGYWSQVEEYIARHSEAKFTHGICPDCMVKLYPNFSRKAC